MQLQTPRLLLKEINADDLDDIHALNSIPEVDEYNTLGLPESVDATRVLVDGWIQEQTIEPQMAYTFSMRLADNDKFIGMIALKLDRAKYRKAEEWYTAPPGYWVYGSTTETLKRSLIHL